MSDTFTDLQTLISDRITAHADLTALTVATEATGAVESTMDTALDSDGIAAVVLAIDFLPTNNRDRYLATFEVTIQERVEGRSFAKNCWEVSTIAFNQLRNWKPSAVWGEIRDLKIETLSFSPTVIRQLTGETHITLE